MNSFTQQKDEPIIRLSAFLLSEKGNHSHNLSIADIIAITSKHSDILKSQLKIIIMLKNNNKINRFSSNEIFPSEFLFCIWPLICLLHLLLGLEIVRLFVGFDVKFTWLQPPWKREVFRLVGLTFFIIHIINSAFFLGCLERILEWIHYTNKTVKNQIS